MEGCEENEPSCLKPSEKQGSRALGTRKRSLPFPRRGSWSWSCHGCCAEQGERALLCLRPQLQAFLSCSRRLLSLHALCILTIMKKLFHKSSFLADALAAGISWGAVGACFRTVRLELKSCALASLCFSPRLSYEWPLKTERQRAVFVFSVRGLGAPPAPPRLLIRGTHPPKTIATPEMAASHGWPFRSREILKEKCCCAQLPLCTCCYQKLPL